MDPQKYHPLTKSFHWLVVLMISAEFILGWIMPGIRRNLTPPQLVSFHMSFGVSILLVMFLRLIWRMTYGSPAAEPGLPWWQKLAARWVHYLLYISVTALPLTGWLLTSAKGWPVQMFGLVTLPSLIPPQAGLVELASTIHVATATTVGILIGVHVAAALYHFFILKDKTLQRMLADRG